MRAVLPQRRTRELLQELQELRAHRVQHEPGGRAESHHLHPETAHQENKRAEQRGLAGGAQAMVQQADGVAQAKFEDQKIRR